MLRCLVSGFAEPTLPPNQEPSGLRQLTTTYSDAGLGVEAALSVPLSTLQTLLPTRCESFFMMAPGSAHANVFREGKARDVLGWNPVHTLEQHVKIPRCKL